MGKNFQNKNIMENRSKLAAWALLLFIPPHITTLTLLQRKRDRKRKRERENGTESSHSPPCSCATSIYTEIATMVWFHSLHVFTRRSPHQRTGHRQSPLRGQRFPQSRSFPGLFFSYLSFLFPWFLVLINVWRRKIGIPNCYSPDLSKWIAPKNWKFTSTTI